MTRYRQYKPNRIQRLADLCGSTAYNIKLRPFRVRAARDVLTIGETMCETRRTRRGDVASAARAMLAAAPGTAPDELDALAADLRSCAEALRGSFAITDEDWLGRRRKREDAA